MQGFDLSTLDTVAASSEARACQLRHPTTNEPLTYTDDAGVIHPVRIWSLGAESGLAKEIGYRSRNKRMKRKNSDFSAEKYDDDEWGAQAELATAPGVPAWEFIEWKGEMLPFTYANVKMIYKTLPWVYNQIVAFTIELANYLGNSESNSGNLESSSSNSSPSQVEVA